MERNGEKIFNIMLIGVVAILVLMVIFYCGLTIYKEIHCWGLDVNTAPRECIEK